MKICISAQGDQLDSKLEPSFGRSPYFIIYDTQTSAFEAIKNSNIEEASGVGIQSGQLIAAKQVQIVLTGKVGPKAANVLAAANIEIVNNMSGTVKEAIAHYQTGDIKSVQETAMNPQAVDNAVDISKTSSWIGRCFRRMFGDRGRGQRGMNSPQNALGRGRGWGCGQGGRGFAASGGACVCPKCGKTIEHQRGISCRSNHCPSCGTIMVRD